MAPGSHSPVRDGIGMTTTAQPSGRRGPASQPASPVQPSPACSVSEQQPQPQHSTARHVASALGGRDGDCIYLTSAAPHACTHCGQPPHTPNARIIITRTVQRVGEISEALTLRAAAERRQR
jgi:hypothetical protein